MSERVNRNCFCCGIGYYYCPTCEDNRDLETWHIMFHEENCKKIFKICTDDFLKYTTRQETIELLNGCDLSHIDNLNKDIIDQINEILASTIVEDPTIKIETKYVSTNKKNHK